ncbi:MAG TPA: transglycosylase SLT domain-containing protein [Burkholderiales bacterium]
MANFLRRLISVQVPAHRLRQERRNMMLFATVAAVLGVVVSYRTISGAEAFGPAQADLYSPEAVAASVDDSTAPSARDAVRHRQIAEHLAKRYRVSADAIQEMVEAAHRAGGSMRLDPLLIIAVIAVESRFNPIAESGAGAKGVMQVIPRYHQDKFDSLGGQKAALDPRANILVGALILREYLDRTGNLTAALQLYAGAAGDPDNGYTRKVLSEHQRLKGFVAQMRA